MAHAAGHLVAFSHRPIRTDLGIFFDSSLIGLAFSIVVLQWAIYFLTWRRVFLAVLRSSEETVFASASPFGILTNPLLACFNC